MYIYFLENDWIYLFPDFNHSLFIPVNESRLIHTLDSLYKNERKVGLQHLE